MILGLCVVSCSKIGDRTPEKRFQGLEATATGIDFKNILTENDSLNYFTYGYIYMGGGVSAGDINNDGLIDLFFTGNQVSNRLYLNLGDLKFEDITDQAGIGGDSRWYTGTTMADVNNDGLLDIYCSVGGKFGPKQNQLFINQGDNSFKEMAETYGLADDGNSVQGTFFDYDRDGDLDLYVANYPPTPFNAPNHYYASKQRMLKDRESDHLYRNDGNTFVDVTAKANLRNFGLSLSATVGDVDADGWPDIYVSNDFSTPDYFYINNRNGTFSEKVKTLTKNTSFYGMGADIADFNNDGLLDIFQVDMSAKDNRRAKANMASMNPELFWSTVNSGFHYQYMQNSLQLNNGTINDSLPDFSNVSRIAGVSSTDWSWGPLFADLDNDGWKDIFVSNGTRREINNNDYFAAIDRNKNSGKDFLAKSLAIPSEPIDNFVFKNNGDLTFERVNADWGLSFKGFSNGGTYADLDNDGDLEIVTNNIDDVAAIFENRNDKNHYVSLQFKGPDTNPFGIGVKAEIRTSGKRQFQEMTLTRGFQSSVAPRLHFGLGEAGVIDTLKVEWPDGKTQWIENINADQGITLDYTNASEPQDDSDPMASEHPKLFAAVTDTLAFPRPQHTENRFDDFEREILLPHKMSTLGPALAVGDLNGDGMDDFVIGGAKGSQTGVYFQTQNGFENQNIAALEQDAQFEDTGAVLFDADNDGDNDLYLVSGGNEVTAESHLLQDRLYLNNGTGNLDKASQALPPMHVSGMKVAPFDFDKDGDLDLFIGGRQIPGAYPAPPESFILENKSTPENIKFEDITPEVAPSLTDIGMVTDASWTDYDNDGWTDLVLTGEWMPITFLRNNRGTFENRTNELGLEDSTGWWFSAEAADFDQDGDMDFIVGNLGLNYKYKANETETFDIYYNDFDKNGEKDIVLSYFNGGKKYPLRGRECSSQQMPGIKKKFENYASFSVATLEDVYTEKMLEKSLHYRVKSFASVYLENKNGEFISHPLPNEAQLSCINQILVDDFNGDSHTDVLIAGNLYASEIETPRNDASNGLLLTGNSAGSFKPVAARKSGFFAPGDVKQMASIEVKGKPYILVAKNDDSLQWILIEGSKADESLATR